MGIPNEARSSRHVERYASYHLAAIKAEPAAAHLVAPTEQLLTALRSAAAAHAAAEQAEVELAALFQRFSARISISMS